MSDETMESTATDEPVVDGGLAEPVQKVRTLSPWRAATLAIAGAVALVVFGAWPALVMILAILVSVMLHETGHFIVARKSGMKCTEYFVGFGPRIWSFKRGETEYGIKALPLGGYVKIIGMSNLEPTAPEDEPRRYSTQAFYKRLTTILAGVTVNFIIAIVLMFVLLTAYGEARSTTSIQTTSRVSLPANVVEKMGIACELDTEIKSTKQCWVDTPAQAAGLQGGDKIIRVNGNDVSSFDDVRDYVSANPGKSVDITYVRAGAETTVAITPMPISLDANGDLDYSEARLGVLSKVEYDRVNPIVAVPRSVHNVGNMSWAAVKAMKTFVAPSTIKNLFHQAAEKPGAVSLRDPAVQTRPLSVLGVVTIANTLGSLANVIALVIGLNVFLAIVNLLPLLPFDGGHAAVAIYERIRTRKNREYRVDMAKLQPVMIGTLIFLLLIGATTFYLDATHPIT